MKFWKSIHCLILRLPSCLHNINLKLFYKLFFTNKFTTVYVGIIIYDWIPSGSVIVLFWFFLFKIFTFKEIF